MGSLYLLLVSEFVYYKAVFYVLVKSLVETCFFQDGRLTVGGRNLYTGVIVVFSEEDTTADGYLHSDESSSASSVSRGLAKSPSKAGVHILSFYESS